MSADYLAHWVEGGDPAAARKYGLTLMAKCGAIFSVPKRKNLSEKPPCPECEAIDGPIPGSLGREQGGRRSRAPHYVYRCYDVAGELLYVGCTVDLNTRRLAHSANSWWFPKMDRSRVTIYPNKFHARRVENAAIRDERPLCNVRGQDFKSWPADRLRAAHDLAVELDATSFAARVARAAGGF